MPETKGFKRGQLKLVKMYFPVPVWVLVLVCQVDLISPFLFDKGECFAPPPCTCIGSYVRCHDRGLTEIPKFKVTNITGRDIYIYLYSNHLTTIPGNAFINLTVSSITRLNLYFSDNNITSLAPDAFNGIADSVSTIYLNNNLLSAIPSELGTLSNLETLNVEGNPITTLSSSSTTLPTLGRTLLSLSIDLKYFTTWPTELGFLNRLTDLRLTNIQNSHLNSDSFDELKGTLTTLVIYNSLLNEIPASICHLQNLQRFSFNNNSNVQVNRPVIEPCGMNLTRVHNVKLQNNRLISMPNVFTSFPEVIYLYLMNNNLSAIQPDLIPNNTLLQDLYLDHNDFTRIPSAINKLSNLVNLWMQYNKLTSVEESDLANLNNLRSLYLGHNPIEYISPQAFSNNHLLVELSLLNTKLRQLPTSLKGLSNIRILDISDNPTDCSCTLSYLKSWYVGRLFLRGTCDGTSKPVKTFIVDELSKCP